MNLTAEQQMQAVEYFEGLSTLRETAAMLQVPWSQFSDDWREGRTDAEAGRDTEAGRWYLAAQDKRNRAKSKLRAEAHATAGTKDSGDLLSLLRTLEAEAEPLAQPDENPRAHGSLALHDMIAAPDTTEAERAEGKAALEDFTRSGLAVLDVLTKRDARRREQRGAA